MLRVVGRAIEKTLHAGKESEIGHVIGFVENTYFDAIEFAEVLTNEIFKATRARNNNIDTLTERVDLRVLTNATEDGGGAKTKTTSKRRNGCIDLQCEFASGRKNERTWAERLTIELQHGKTSEHSETEGKGLTGTGTTAAENIAALQRVGKG
jgi:hypothetical protein